MNPIYDFKGEVALVTGAGKGMGQRCLTMTGN
jgi:NAD(P)-dependent dehydrogenase (short-subunit alcohol dehydrogenase family)